MKTPFAMVRALCRLAEHKIKEGSTLIVWVTTPQGEAVFGGFQDAW
ncbi:hypothetical protein GWN42_24090 [candidate division KSB1 bacterium]|nr:hypothetical protein [Phycisphaerae bacterium]NIV95788.1 hypothetical protein [candidate division KSB1 bacterium]